MLVLVLGTYSLLNKHAHILGQSFYSKRVFLAAMAYNCKILIWVWVWEEARIQEGEDFYQAEELCI